MSFNNRSNALIELFDELNENDLQYVLVGGYAVSAFNTRFSTDLDIVVAPDNKDASYPSSKHTGSRKSTTTQNSGFTTRKSSSTKNASRHSNRSASICSLMDSAVVRPKRSGRSTTYTTTAQNKK